MRDFGVLRVGVTIKYGRIKNKAMRKAILTNKVTGAKVRVHSTTEHPDSSYGHEIWVDDNNISYLEVGAKNPFYEIHEYK